MPPSGLATRVATACAAPTLSVPCSAAAARRMETSSAAAERVPLTTTEIPRNAASARTGRRGTGRECPRRCSSMPRFFLNNFFAAESPALRRGEERRPINDERLQHNRLNRRWLVQSSRWTYAVAGPEGSRVKRRPNQSADTPGEEPRLERSGDREIEHTQSCREAGHRRRVGTPELDDRARITPSNRGAGRAGKPLALAMGSLTIAEGKFTHARTINNFFAAELKILGH